MSGNAPSLRRLKGPYETADDLAEAINGFFQDAGNLFSAGITFDNLNAVLRVVTVTPQSPFTTATLTAPWATETGYSAVSYSKQGGVVRLRGACDGGTYSGTAIFTLPASCWPPAAVSFPAVQDNATFTPTGRVNISAAGVVTAPDIPAMQTGVSTFLSFDGITFDAAGSSGPTPQAPFPLYVSLSGVSGQIKAAWVASCFDVTSGSPVPYAFPTLTWGSGTQSGRGMLVVNALDGLTPGRTYKVGIVIFGG